GKFPELTTEEWDQFEVYGLMDTRILREVYYRMPPLPASERWIWEWTFKRNLKGIRIDKSLVLLLKHIVDTNRPGLEKEFAFLTGCLKIKSTKCEEWFQQFWPNIQDMRRDTVRDMLLECDGKPDHAVRALQIKEMAGSSSIAKVDTVT